MKLANRTPLAAKTHETAIENLVLSNVLQHYIDAMSQSEIQTKKQKMQNKNLVHSVKKLLTKCKSINRDLSQSIKNSRWRHNYLASSLIR